MEKQFSVLFSHFPSSLLWRSCCSDAISAPERRFEWFGGFHDASVHFARLRVGGRPLGAIHGHGSVRSGSPSGSGAVRWSVANCRTDPGGPARSSGADPATRFPASQRTSTRVAVCEARTARSLPADPEFDSGSTASTAPLGGKARTSRVDDLREELCRRRIAQHGRAAGEGDPREA